MLVGDRLPLDPDWSVVEGDLYDISRRVREYDSEARLVRNDQSGALGLARVMPAESEFPAGTIVFAAYCLDPASAQRMYGEPDGRVLKHQMIADGHRIQNHTVWVRRRRDAMRAERDAEQRGRAEWSREMAKELVWRRNHVDLGRRSSFQIPRQV